MTALATIDELKNNLDWTLDPQEESVATQDLEHASNLVRTYGLPWTPDNVPPMAKSIVIQAARRHMVNIQGLTQSRAGDETLAWDGIGERAGSVYLTDEEKHTLSVMKGVSGFGSIGTTAWFTRRGAATQKAYGVPTTGGKDFPWFSDPEEPW